MSITFFPPAQALDACIKIHPLLANDRDILEKGLINGLANVFADRKVPKEDLASKIRSFLNDKMEALNLPTIVPTATSMNIEAALSSCSCSNLKVAGFCTKTIQAEPEPKKIKTEYELPKQVEKDHTGVKKLKSVQKCTEEILETV